MSRVPTRLVIGFMLGLVAVLVAASAVIAALRGSRDAPPTVLGGIGRPARSTPATPPPSSGQRVETARIAVTLPEGWSTVSTADDELVAAGRHAVVDLSVRTASDTLTQANLADDITAGFQRRYPDARICRPPAPAGIDNGPEGVAFAVCYTVIPQNGRAVATNALVVAALVTQPDGSRDVFRESGIYAEPDAASAVEELDPVTSSIRWRTLHLLRATVTAAP
ncbi:MAG: hypothetical protein ABR564_04385 [Candidatus Dormibacteria bacterium]